MIKIAICDDEEFFLNQEAAAVRSFFSGTKFIYSIDTFISGNEFLKLQKDSRDYDLIFLDVNMDEIDGIEIAKRIRKFSDDVILIFVTAFVHYSSDGYQVNVSRFILKDDFLEKSITECLACMVPEIYKKRQQIILPFKDREIKIKYDDVLYIESFLHRSFFYLKESGCHILSGKNDNLDEWLKKSGFIQIQKGYQVNFKYVKSIERFYLTMENGDKLNISRERYQKICQEFISYKGVI